jgi:secondary thiamine-phosphate synthase enzyme
MWIQKQIKIKAQRRGFHLITDAILRQIPELRQVSIGMMNIFIQHTSASLTINENADPSVRDDFEAYFNNNVRENEPYYTHNDEGPDDMPAHLKSSILGSSLNIPITDGRLNMGLWQGIYLCEHRDHASGRQLMVTIQGE